MCRCSQGPLNKKPRGRDGGIEGEEGKKGGREGVEGGSGGRECV